MMTSSTPFSSDSISASGNSTVLNLPTLQSKMKSDPEGYNSELSLIYSQFKSSLDLFRQQAALNFSSLTGVSSDNTVSKDLSDRVMFLAHVKPFYPKELSEYPNELVEFLKCSAGSLPSGVRENVTKALILLVNRQAIDIGETLEVFMDLQSLGDKALKSLAFSHIVHSIKRMNLKHKSDPKNRALQNMLFRMLQKEDVSKAKQALITLCDLYRRRVWFDERTANAICMACFHPSPRVMNSGLAFLLDFEKIEDEDSDDSGSEDEAANKNSHVVLNKEAIYKANHKGTTSSKKKKKAKLERVARSMKRQQRRASEKGNINCYSPLNHLKDPEGFAEKLFSYLQKNSGEMFEKKMMLFKVVARTIGLHRLTLCGFYEHLKNYIEPHQKDVTELLAAAVQACHDLVPPEEVEPLFKQIVNKFVHDKSRPEAISVGLNAVREICLRMPLLMTEDLLQDLVLYRKSNEKPVSSSARSLLTLFREICPSLLVKKDRGRPTGPKAMPKAFGETQVSSSIPGLELLEEDNGNDDDDEIDDAVSDGDGEDGEDVGLAEKDSDGEFEIESDNEMDEDVSDEDDNSYDSDDDEMIDEDKNEDDIDKNVKKGTKRKFSDEDDNGGDFDDIDQNVKKAKKRKFKDFEGQLNDASNSLRALKKLAGETMNVSAEPNNDGFLSNEDFKRIKELQAKKDANKVLSRHGFKVPTSNQLSAKRVDASKLEANIKTKFTKQERLELIRAGREDTGKYQARTAIKQKKTGGSSNRQKEHNKPMPIAAKRAKVARTRVEKKKVSRYAGKQFRGRKAWK